MKYKLMSGDRNLCSFLIRIVFLLMSCLVWINPGHAAVLLPTGTAGVAYSYSIVIPSDDPSCSSGINFNGRLPTGMGFSYSGCTLTFIGTPRNTGSFSMTFKAVGSSGVPTAYQLDIQAFATSIALSTSATSISYGDQVTLSVALLSGAAATGSVTFKDGANTIGSATVSGNAASLSINTLSPGTHDITAVYSGDSYNATVTSSAVTVTVSKVTPTISVSASNTAPSAGASVSITANLNSPLPVTGTVIFKDGSTTLGSASVSGTSATFSTSSLSAGSHSITAVYGGDAYNLTVTSSAVNINVIAAPTLTLSTSQSSVTLGGSLTFTASLATGASPTGTVTFKDGASTLGSVSLSGTTASFSTSALSAGQHSITAIYGGDANNLSATSSTVVVTVTASPGLTLTASQLTINVGTAITLTANLSAGVSPTGTVTFKDGANAVGSANVAGSSASLILSNLVAGTHSLTASYAGDANNAMANSGVVTVVVNALVLSPSVTSVLPASGPAAGGTAVTLSGSNLGGVTSVSFGGTAATIVASSQTSITVTTAAHDAGTVDVVLASSSGTITASKAYTYAALPDPTKNAAVIAGLTAQAQSARMFANTQLGNFTQRLDSLRSGRTSSSFGLTFNNRARDVAAETAWARNGDVVASPVISDSLQSGDLRSLRHGLKKTALGAEKSTPDEAVKAASNNYNLPEMPSGGGEIPQPFLLWIGGAVDFGEQKPGVGQNGLRFTTSGISFGGDYRLDEKLTLGLGFGYSRSNSDTDNLGSKSIGQGMFTVIYGSYRPVNHWYIDGILGYGSLDFDLTRNNVADGGSVKGSRRGGQTFASLTSGYEFEGESWMLSPYGRLDLVRSSLNPFSETGGASALAYSKQTISSDAVSLGLRGEVRHALDIGTLVPQAQIAYQQGLQHNGRAGISYADLADAGPAYFVSDSSQDNKQWLSNLGFRLLLKSGMTISMYYSRSIANALVSAQSVSLTFSGRF